MILLGGKRRLSVYNETYQIVRSRVSLNLTWHIFIIKQVLFARICFRSTAAKHIFVATLPSRDKKSNKFMESSDS